MFEDLIPAAAQTPAPPRGLFDDLIPAGGAGGAVGEPPVPAQPQATLGSVLKQAAIGVPEGIIGMAGSVHDAMNGTYLAHSLISALAGEKTADEMFPYFGKVLHEALPAPLNPENYPARNLPERIARGVGEALPAVAIPGGSFASRVLTQTLAGATGAAAAEVAPDRYKPAAQLVGNLIGAGTAGLRSTRAAIVDAIKSVGIAPEHVDPADIDNLARSVTRRDLLTLNAFKQPVLGDALKRGFVTPEEFESVYGKGAADEYRGPSTPANGEAAPPQGAQGGGPGGDAPQVQQLTRPGENGGEANVPAAASPDAVQPVKPAARDVQREPAQPDQSEPGSPAAGGAPNNAAGPEETARPDEIKPDNQATATEEAKQSQNAQTDQQSPEHPAPPLIAARLTGDELGPTTDLKHLRFMATQYARENLRGRVVVNRETGHSIEINWSGLKKALSGTRGSDLLRALPGVPDMLERGRYLGAMPDAEGRRGIRAVHIFESAAALAGKRLDTILFVRETNDGRFFYDYGIKRGDTGMPGPGR